MIKKIFSLHNINWFVLPVTAALGLLISVFDGLAGGILLSIFAIILLNERPQGRVLAVYSLCAAIFLYCVSLDVCSPFFFNFVSAVAITSAVYLVFIELAFFGRGE